MTVLRWHLLVRVAGAAAASAEAARSANRLFGRAGRPERAADGTWCVPVTVELRGLSPDSPGLMVAAASGLLQAAGDSWEVVETSQRAPVTPAQLAAALELADGQPLPHGRVKVYDADRSERVLARLVELAASLAPLEAAFRLAEELKDELERVQAEVGRLEAKAADEAARADKALADLAEARSELESLRALVAAASDALRKGRIGRARRMLRGA